MKHSFMVVILLLTTRLLQAQDSPIIPIKVTIFSEAIGLPGFRNIFSNPNFGMKIGTEFYYRNSTESQLFQTVNVGFYAHRQLQQTFFVSSEFGYRKMFNNFFADATLGVGYMLIDSALPRYKKSGNEYVRASDVFGRVMPTVGLGLGYNFPKFSLFTRYEAFAELPFGYGDIPALPHKSFHVGAKINMK